MRRSTLLSIISFFSLLGIADSLYLTEHALTDTALSCGLDGALSGCNVVAQSAYSHFLGIPLGLYGLIFYIAIFVLSILVRVRPGRHTVKSLMVASVLGMTLSIYFVWLQVFVIDALCIYCLASFAFAVIIFIVSMMFVRIREHLPPIL